jgi:6,7-dimethyl-8-ribityllumazine synthase
MKLGIVLSTFNEGITTRMKKAALAKAKDLKIDVVQVIEVPGAYDIPFACKMLLEKKKVDAIATLGAIIKGDTDHDQLIAYTTAKTLTKLSLKYQKPISMGIIGPGASEAQAKKRAEEYAERAVETAQQLCHINS